MNFHLNKQNKKHSLYLGITEKFQWIGFILSTDNATFGNDYFLFEFRFIIIRFWYIYKFKTNG